MLWIIAVAGDLCFVHVKLNAATPAFGTPLHLPLKYFGPGVKRAFTLLIFLVARKLTYVLVTLLALINFLETHQRARREREGEREKPGHQSYGSDGNLKQGLN